ncbi:hypothetical protein [Cumulibacter manganitolerans]|uniref:hypothetical protein n=1 Tax=Cumulibacter manganitolerans TaxID=1884992 RepID=UPI001296AEFC|nr:hypothetical protein [Cumulibacter manganitolerans]
MPRHNRRSSEPERTSSFGGVFGGAVVVEWRGEPWRVMPITGAAAAKEYRCPGCDQVVRVRQGHVVVWSEYDRTGEDRRHWHTGCWAARDRRGPGIQRSGRAPRR